EISRNVFQYCSAAIGTFGPLCDKLAVVNDELSTAAQEEFIHLNVAVDSICADGFKFRAIFEEELKVIVIETCSRYASHFQGEGKSAKISVVLKAAGTRAGIAGTGLAVGIAAGLVTGGVGLIVAGVFVGKALIDAATEVGMMLVQLSQNADELREQFIGYTLK